MSAEVQATEEAFRQLEELRNDPARKALRVAVEARHHEMSLRNWPPLA